MRYTIFTAAALGGSLASTVSAQTTTWPVPPPATADPNTIADCTNWAIATGTGGNICQNMAKDNGITIDQFLKYNPSATSSCNLITGNAYCVEKNFSADPVVTPTPTPSTPSGPQAPGPTQAGQIQSCTRWDLVSDSMTCNTFTTKYPGLTLDLLVKWNPAIGTTCRFLELSTYLCTLAEGWTPPTVTTGTPRPTDAPPADSIQAGQPANCNKWIQAVDGDNCSTVPARAGVPSDKFFEWNPAVNPKTCSGLWLTYYYCVGIPGFTPSPTSSPTTPTGGSNKPDLVQPGTPDNCNKWTVAIADDNCDKIIARAGIPADNFFQWNPAVNRKTCGGLWAQYSYCTGVAGFVPPPVVTPPTGPSKPDLVQPGTPDNCNKWTVAIADDNCDKIIARAGISADNFFKWNPAVNRKTCGGLWAQYSYCTGVPGSSPTPTKPGNGVQTPSPIQNNMTPNCKKFHWVQKDQNCDTISRMYGISTATFFSWNPSTGSHCQSLWGSTYACVAVLP